MRLDQGMKRGFFARLSLLASLLSAPAAAQYADENTQPVVDGAWCATIPNGETCGFGSAVAACQASVAGFYPNSSGALVSVEMQLSSATCFTDRNRVTAAGDIWQGMPTARYDCDGGTAQGGLCVSIPPAPAATCGLSGGMDGTAGNPIDLQSGLKIERRFDYATDDGRFGFSRTYVSRGPGHGLRSRQGGMGANWQVDQIPSLSIPDEYTLRLTLPGGQKEELYCYNEQTCGAEQLFITGVGRERARIERNHPDFEFPFQRSGQLIPIRTSDGALWLYRLRKYRGEVFAVIERAEFPGGYSIDYTSRRRIDEVKDSNGNLLYIMTPAYYDITKMEDSFGRVMTFVYDTIRWEVAGSSTDVWEIPLGSGTIPRPSRKGLLTRVDLPDGTSLRFDYDAATSTGARYAVRERLTGMRHLSSTGQVINSESYVYEVPDKPYYMTGLIDGEGIRYASWEYDGHLAVASEHAGGVERTEIDYTLNPNQNADWLYAIRRARVTNPLGRDTVYDKVDEWEAHFSSISGQPTANCAGDVRQVSFNQTYREELETTDAEGRVTLKRRDERGLVTFEDRARGTTERIVTRTDWHPDYPFPTRIRRPGVTDERSYDGLGRMLTRTLTDTYDATTPVRTWTYTYDGPNVASFDGPLSGAADTVFLTWTGSNLTSATDAVGLVTNYANHNPNGAPGMITLPNGAVTQITYDARNRPVTIVKDQGRKNANTTITYDANDLITRIDRPNGNWMTFTYTPARWLQSVSNRMGETIRFEHDSAGNVTRTIMEAPNGKLLFEHSSVRDEIGRIMELRQSFNANRVASTEIDYDREHNPVRITDPRGSVFEQSFDALDRLTDQIDALGGETTLDHERHDDGRGMLASVNDPRGAQTTYERNGFGEVIAEISPEMGRTDYVRDVRGLITRKTDARGQVVNYTYDAAGRLKTERYPGDPESDVTYTYDQRNNGEGQLTTVTESFGVTRYYYNGLGQLTQEHRVLGGRTFKTKYWYDLSGGITKVQYPSGLIVNTPRDHAGRVKLVKGTDPDGAATNLLRGIRYRPFGPMTRAIFGDGHTLTIGYDRAYQGTRLRRVKSGTALMDLQFSYDLNGNITKMRDRVDESRTQLFRYDRLDRLTRAEQTGGYGLIQYGYNPGGDRLYRNLTPVGGTTERETYSYVDHRLDEIMRDGQRFRSFVYAASGQMVTDDNGDRVSAPLLNITLNGRGRMAEVRNGNTVFASYTHDVSELRLEKVTASGTVHYHYDQQGRLIEESDGATGAVIRSYVWLGLTPVATYGEAPAPSTARPLTYLHADHLGRPMLATDTSGNTVWHGGITTPFGQQVSGVGAMAQNLMFPGQYADAETGWFENWHRSYDPTLGRYLQSDPIGLAGGLNRYAYVGGNPTRHVDPTGRNILEERLGKNIEDFNVLEKIAVIHMYRNVFNVTYCTLPEAEAASYTQLLPPLDKYHRLDVNYPGDSDGNQKWLSPDGKSEAIYDVNGNLVTNVTNAGTYNYVAPAAPLYDPRNFGANIGHIFWDVLPYEFFGTNGPPFPLGEPNCSCDHSTSTPRLRGRIPL